MTTYNTPEITYYLDYEGAFVCPDIGDLDFIGQTNIVHYSQQFKKSSALSGCSDIFIMHKHTFPF